MFLFFNLKYKYYLHLAAVFPGELAVSSNSKMNRQFTSSSNGGEEEFSAEELQEFAQAFKVILNILLFKLLKTYYN